MGSSLDQGEVEPSLDGLASIARAVGGASVAAVSLASAPESPSVCGVAEMSAEQVAWIRCHAPFAESMTQRVVDDGLDSAANVRFYAVFPMMGSLGQHYGAVWILNPEPHLLCPQQMQALAALAAHAGELMEIRQLIRELQQQLSEREERERALGDRHLALLAEHMDLLEQSRTDPLTGLPNRRAMALALERAVAQAEDRPRQPCVALIDIDHFKDVNDLHGHAAGDCVLAELGKLLRSHVAGSGMAARYGGEEFVILVEDEDVLDVQLQCEFLRLAVPALPVGVPVTVSIGLAAHRLGDGVERTLARADAAMYRAKASGRNRVELAP